MIPTRSKPWLTMSATECTASASMADEPVTAYAPALHRKMAALEYMATFTA